LNREARRSFMLAWVLLAVAVGVVVASEIGPWAALVHVIGFVLIVAMVGPRWAGIILALSFAAALSLSLAGGLVVAGYGMSGIMLARGASQGRHGVTLLVSSMVPAAIVTLAAFSLPLLVGGGSRVDAEIEKTVESALSFYRRSGMAEAELARMKVSLSRMAYAAVRLSPSISLCWTAVSVWVGYGVARRLGAKAGLTLGGSGSLVSFKLPGAWVWLLASGLALMVTRAKVLFPVGANVSFFAVAGFGLQGLAVIHSVLAGRHTNRVLEAAMLAVATLLFLPVVTTVLVLVGFLDTWFDFRTRSAV